MGRNLGFGSIGLATRYRVACIGEVVRVSVAKELVAMPLEVSWLRP